jgi:hypothetical protein
MSHRGNVVLDGLAVFANGSAVLPAACTPVATGNTFEKLQPGDKLTCTASVPLSLSDLESATAVSIGASASCAVASTGQALSDVTAQAPVQLTPNPALQLDLDVVAESCVVETTNASGRRRIDAWHTACCCGGNATAALTGHQTQACAMPNFPVQSWSVTTAERKGGLVW